MTVRSPGCCGYQEQPHNPGSERNAGLAGGRSHGHAQGLCWPGALTEKTLRLDPYSGHLFVLRGRRGNLIKVIWWDGQWACLFANRLERGRFV